MRKRLIALLCGLLTVVFLLGGLIVWHSQDRCKLRLERTCLSLEYATTPAQLALGLGGRDAMPNNHGMLFVLDQHSPACFWMKDMHYNLDIIWLDAARRITTIQLNVSPSSYPHSYCPSLPAAYVLEVNASVADSNRLQIGQRIDF